MKNFIPFLFVICCITSCTNVAGRLEKERKMWDCGLWKQQFKDYTLCQCLIKGYGDKAVADRISFVDRSFASPINYAMFDSAANTVIKPVLMDIKNDSAKSIGIVSESGAGKRVFSKCMAFYKSAALEKLTDQESKRWEKIKSIDSVISKKVPAF